MSRKEEPFVMDHFIKDICEEIGPRLGTYSAEKQAGIKIKGILEKKVDEVILEDFKCHPAAFLDFTRVAWITIIIGTLFFWWFPIVSAVLYLYAVSIFLFEQMYLKEYVDFFFPERTGTNVIGKLKAAAEPKQIVICSGHHDSAYEFPLFAKFKSKFGLLAYSTAATIILSAITSITKFLLDLFALSSLSTNIPLLCVPLVCIGMTAYLAFKLHTKMVIPGANDNLSGVAVVLALAHHFASQRLKNIELWFISFSCEECMRGSKRFVQKHREELKNSRTINFDMVGKGEICIISAEPYYTTKHSFEFAQEIQKSTDLPIKVVHFGGTDAACFSKKGLKAVSFVGLTPHNYPDTWHEMTDTPKIIQPEKLDKTFESTIKYLKDLDKSLD
jgi:ABC-type multidrug transport system fused ATPase/permease subunit